MARDMLPPRDQTHCVCLMRRLLQHGIWGCIVSQLGGACVLPDFYRSEESEEISKGGASVATETSSTGGAKSGSGGRYGEGGTLTEVRTSANTGPQGATPSSRGGSSNSGSRLEAGGTRAQVGTAGSGNTGGSTNRTSSTRIGSGTIGGSRATSAGQAGAHAAGTPSANCQLGITNLLDDAAKSEEFNWIGGDNTLPDDDPCGFQGAFYAYGDKGADEIAGNTDDSLQSPKIVSGTEYASPCVKGKCCIKGNTSLWPAKDVYTTWGAGLGLAFSDAADGGGKRAYLGPAKGLRISFTAKMVKQMLRIGFTQSATDESAPFVSVPGFSGDKEVEVMFSDPTCPTWATACIDPTSTPYDLQIQVAGGDAGADGPFELCVTRLVPIR